MFASRRSRWMLIGGVLAIVLAAGTLLWSRLAGPLLLDAPRPQAVADLRDRDPADSASVVEARVSYNLGTAVEALEAAVPRTFGDIGEKLPVASNTRASYAFAVSRSPFRVQVVQQTLSISADIEYEGRVWYRPVLGPELTAGCGTGEEPRPRVRATLVSSGRLTPNWELRTRTRVLRLEPYSDEPRDRCRLTILRLDETGRVIEGTRGMLTRRLAAFDREAARWPVRAKFERLWTQLQRPIRLTDDIYLEINPYAAQLGAAGAVGDTAAVLLRLIASPRIVTSRRPDVLRPLPRLQASGATSQGAHVTLEAAFSYPVATTLLRQALVGRSLVQARHRLRITDVNLAGIGGGRVALGVTLAGRVSGRLYFTGTPSFDSTRHEVCVPDLDYDVGTAQLLVNSLGWLQGVDIRDFLRERARLPDSAVVGKLRALAEKGINRTLAPGVLLSGRIHSARGTRVHATTREIRVSAVADAEFGLAIDRPPAFPGARKTRVALVPNARSRSGAATALAADALPARL